MDNPLNYACNRIFIFGHSYIKRLRRSCTTRGLVNLGFPAWYEIDFLGISGARLEHLQDSIPAILAFKPEVLILDLEGNDLTNPDLDVHYLSGDLLVTIQNILDQLPAILSTRVVLLEQHYRNKVAGSGLHNSVYNHWLYEWHEDLSAFECIDPRIKFQPLLGLNGSQWFAELCDGVHLKEDALS